VPTPVVGFKFHLGVTFQTSTLAAMVLFILLHAIYLRREFYFNFRELWLPVFITLLFILPANFSTALIFQWFDVGFIGKYPLRYIGIVVGSGIVFLTFFILIAKRFQMLFPIV
jgi:cell division protein FtsW